MSIIYKSVENNFRKMGKINMKDEELRNLILENAKGIKELRESQRKTDEQMKKTDAKLDRLAKMYGESENNKWMEVEEYFYRYFSKNRKIWEINFYDVDRNIISSDWQEHDIVLINWKASALVSVKYKLKKRDIDNMIDKELKRVKYFFNRLWSKHRLYGWIASFIVSDELRDYAKKRWLYIFTRKGDDVEALFEKDFVWAEF